MINAKQKLEKEILDLTNRSERVGIMRERVRIIDALHDQGPTGDNFEMKWDDLLRILNPDAE